MHPLEETLGHTFSVPGLLEQALTHPSVAYELHRPHTSNQRLEFLGDAVLQLLLTDFLFRAFPTFHEGSLTKLRARVVSRGALAALARNLGLGDLMQMGRGEEAAGGRQRDSTLADAMEAVVGALYLDAGVEVTRRIVLSLFADTLQKLTDEPREVNPKGQLQETLQTLALGSPGYTIVSEDGPDHRKVFVATVAWNGRVLGTGTGNSKKQAQTAAAAAALLDPEVAAMAGNPLIPDSGSTMADDS